MLYYPLLSKQLQKQNVLKICMTVVPCKALGNLLYSAPMISKDMTLEEVEKNYGKSPYFQKI